MSTLIIYCHPSSDSFTCLVKEAFIKGLKDSEQSYEISDLYAMRFNPVMSEREYAREAYYVDNNDIPADVKAEQEKINRADNIVFIFPNFWTSAPAMLEGWFQRVWTYGFAYGEMRMKRLNKALFLMTMGGSLSDKIRQEQFDSIKCSMVGDRMHGRAKIFEFYVFDEMTRSFDNDENRSNRVRRFCKDAYQLGKRMK
ncbi:MAG TPA: NAD(P)H-dependent oxidoreductase [Paludibacteraceae bacterium]|nr:NAD(P)H-dependent oxidoreductase [Paludibacteraceae bacterium]HOU69142.1 NAD(P)H-dependent oxidoreductase [Paludibacteraceae bacterium]HPH63451.1 NAD(P)H-dependent oxidoreductase [Paludibacteraceae bacterium]HQF50931.1 NAD(P)H-dependent oxidoreductase [Paludibacteraceae bacterium]